MSDTRRDARPFDKLRVGPSDVEGRGARFDEAIDRAVREMLDVEPPAGLRGRVLDRIETVAPPPRAAADVHLPTAPLASRPPQTRPPIVVAKGSTLRPRGQQSIAAATLPADSPFEGAQVEALAGPHPIAIDRLSGPPPPSVSDVSVAPIQIRALEISALTETPPERREE